MILDVGTTSFGNRSLFTELKENAPLLKYSGPMYIDFYEYLQFSKKMLMKVFNVIMVMLIIQAICFVHMG